MPLTDPQRAILTELDVQKQAVENAVHQYNRLLRDTILQLAARIETLEARYATH